MRNWWNPNYLLLKSPNFAGEIPIFTTEIPGSGWFHWRICRSLTLRRGRNARVQLWGWGSGAPRVRRRHGGVQRLWKRWKLRILQIDTPMQLPNGTLGVTIVIINHESDRTFIFHDTPVIQSDWYTKGSTKYRCGKPNGERRSEIDLHWWVVHIVSLQNGIWENIMGIWDLMESFMRSNVIFPGNFVWYDIAFTHVASAVSVLNLHEASSELYRFIPWFNYEI